MIFFTVESLEVSNAHHVCVYLIKNTVMLRNMLV